LNIRIDTGTVLAAASRRQLTASGLDAFEPGWFIRGLVTFTSGANANRSQEVKRHTLSGSTATIELWQPMALDIAADDTFAITAGCDKRFPICQAKFDNAVNFRGFPHMPGNDYILAVAKPGEPVTTADRG
jgi:uncharacterized phage protein (TIGR02218 family)